MRPTVSGGKYPVTNSNDTYTQMIGVIILMIFLSFVTAFWGMVFHWLLSRRVAHVAFQRIWNVILVGVEVAVIGGRLAVGLGSRIYTISKWGVPCVFKHMHRVVAMPFAWTRRQLVTGSQDCALSIMRSQRSELDLHHMGLAFRSWTIVEDTANLCRAQLGLDRTTDPSDPANRTLVRKSVWGILSDRKRYPDLRDSDATRLLPFASELALSPTKEDIESLDMGSSLILARRRELAQGEWRNASPVPRTWGEWVASFFGERDGGVYLPAVRPPSF